MLILGSLHSILKIQHTDPRRHFLRDLIQRVRGVLELRQTAQAVDEFESVRAANAGDATALYPLAVYFRNIGLYRSSILCASEIIRLSPARTAMSICLSRILRWPRRGCTSSGCVRTWGSISGCIAKAEGPYPYFGARTRRCRILLAARRERRTARPHR